MKKLSVRKLTILAMFCAMAVVLSLFIRIPLVPAVPWLTFDGKDIVIGLAGFLFGPGAAALVSGVSAALELLFHGGNILDWLMDFLSSCSLVCTASWIYQKYHTKNGAFFGLMAGIAANIVVMALWNCIITPFYYGWEFSQVAALIPAISLFNFLKCAINSVVLLLIYKPVSRALHAAGFMETPSQTASGSKTAAGVGLFILATIAVVLLVILNQ